MVRKKRMLVLAVASVPALVVAAACSFPSPDYQPVSTGEAGGGQETGAVVEAGLGDEVLGGDAQVKIDGADPDALVVKDAGGKVDTDACAANDCDCDDDTFNDLTKAGCADAGGPADCDDTDTRTRPDQGFLEVKGEPPRNGDWNCKNGVERLYPKTNLKCGDVAVGAECDGTFGFEDNPACGAKGTFVTCKTSCTALLICSCVVVSRDVQHTQACK